MSMQHGPMVAIHSRLRGGFVQYTPFAGSNPLGPRGGRCGKAVDGAQLADWSYLPKALRAADVYLHSHPRARLILTPSRAAEAVRLFKNRIVIE